ncbi:MAG: DUF1275 domain-containing protein [Proteobacteria bacterium]|nr:DUF1275 domain-containing protein [Pseudomonadota bacterium]
MHALSPVSACDRLAATIRCRARERAFATGRAVLAGYVDAIGFLHLGGYFVSFMSGNSTRLGLGLGASLAEAVVPAALVASFVTGVMAGTAAGHVAGPRKRPALLLSVAALLLVAGVPNFAGPVFAAMLVTAAAMGALNGTFERDGKVTIGVTYMTGTLVKLGQRLAGALLGGDRLGWTWYLLLWLGLVAGAVTGAVVYRHIGLEGLWIAAGLFVAAAAIVPKN